MEHLVLIDGHHLMYRAYWAIPRTLKTRNGEQTNAVFGFASMLLNIVQTEEPDNLVICFDAGSDTFRHQENETYKDGRAETPDDFYIQIPRIMECVAAFGFTSVADPQYEADDFLGAYAIAADKEGMRTTIVTGDRDALQLPNESIRVAIPHKGYQKQEYLDSNAVYEKYGIWPHQVPAYKGLVGDSSDNLPGVRGIGPKTAALLLQQYETLDGIYAHLDSIKGAAKQKLIHDRDQAYFCERMATLATNIALPVSLKETSIETIPLKRMQELFTELEFTLLVRRLRTLAQTSYGRNRTNEADLVAVSSSPKTASENQLSLF